MPDLFKFTDIDLSPVCKERSFEIQNEDTLAQLVAELIMGQSYHVGQVLDALNDQLAATFHEKHKAVNIGYLKKETTTQEKRDGWIFQMISWIIVYLEHRGETFRQYVPHQHPAQHGVDGFAIVVKDNHLQKIIITEDKCTTYPRKLIREQVFPEFDKYEDSSEMTTISDYATTLLYQIPGNYMNLQNEVSDSNLWCYRISITRDDAHNGSDKKIAKLYADYDEHVKGKNVDRRTSSSTYIENLRTWMDSFSEKIIEKIEAL